MRELPTDTHRIGAKRSAEGLDAAIARVAEAQKGLIGREQLADLDAGRGAIRVRVARKRLHRVQPGVFAVGHRVLSPDGRLLAAVMSAGPDAAASHRSAGALWDIRGWRGRPEVTTPRRVRRASFAVHQQHLPTDEIRIVRGVPVTCVPRTVLDLAGVLRRGDFEKAFEQVLVRELSDPLSLPDLMERYPKRPGVATLRELLGHLEPTEVTREELERLFKRFLRSHRIPRPRLNLCVEGFEVDCVWWDERVIVELDGRSTHLNPLAFERDRERDRILAAAGWLVIRITWLQLRDEPARVAADLGACLSSRRPIRTA